MAAVVDAQRRRALRDVALIHVMYDLLARSNELVLMEWDRLTSDDDGGGSYHMGKHKTDQEGRGTDFYLRPDTMVALAAWREVSPFSQFIFHGVAEEPVLAHGGLPRNTKEADKIAERSAAKDLLELHTHLQPREVSVILRRAEKLGGVKMPKLSGHSGRVGATQDMLLGGATTEEVKRAGRWKSDVMPARYGSKALAKISGENRFAKVERMMAEKKKRSDH
jgi:integrase